MYNIKSAGWHFDITVPTDILINIIIQNDRPNFAIYLPTRKNVLCENAPHASLRHSPVGRFNMNTPL